MNEPRLSLCVITKNEEQMLPGCLASVCNTVDEMVVVDTGSTDRTREVARAAGARVIEHPWRDFADARNASVQAATGDWILVLDADERLAPGAGKALREHARAPTAPLGLMRLHNAARVDAPAAEVLSGKLRMGAPAWLPRFLQRTPDLAYEGAVHESVEAWAARHGFKVSLLPADIVHLGEVPELRRARGKRARNIELLRARCEAEPTNVTPFGYLAMEYLSEGRYHEAQEVVDRGWAVRLLKPKWKTLARLAVTRGILAILRLEPDVALECIDVCEASDGPSAESHLVRGWARELLAYAAPVNSRERAEHLRAAEASARAAISFADRATLDQCLFGAARWLAWTRLGFALLAGGKLDTAGEAFEQALSSMPGHPEAVLGKAEVHLWRGDPAAALATVEPCIGEAPDLWALASHAASALGASADAAAFRAQALASKVPWLTPLWRARVAR